RRGSRRLLRRAVLSVAGGNAGRPPADRGLPPALAAAAGHLPHARPCGTSPAHARQLAAGDGAGGTVTPGVRDPVKAHFEVLDERFRRCGGDDWLECLHTGCRWTEGPAYFPAGRYLVFSDIPNDRTLRWDETTGAVGVFRQPAGYANGHTVDRQGRLVSCELGLRRVPRAGPDWF